MRKDEAASRIPVSYTHLDVYKRQVFASWPHQDVEEYLELTERFLISLREKSETL